MYLFGLVIGGKVYSSYIYKVYSNYTCSLLSTNWNSNGCFSCVVGFPIPMVAHSWMLAEIPIILENSGVSTLLRTCSFNSASSLSQPRPVKQMHGDGQKNLEMNKELVNKIKMTFSRFHKIFGPPLRDKSLKHNRIIVDFVDIPSSFPLWAV